MLRGESTRQKLPLAEIINEPRAPQHLFLSKKNERKLKKVLDRPFNLCYNKYVIKRAVALQRKEIKKNENY